MKLYRRLGKYGAAAADMQDRVIIADLKQIADGEVEFDRNRQFQAIIHTRQDLVLLVSYAYSLNEQVATIRWLLWVVAVLLGVQLFL